MESNIVRKSSIPSSKRILTAEGNILSIILVNHNPIIMGLLCNYRCISRVYIALYTSIYFIKKNIFPQAYFFHGFRANIGQRLPFSLLLIFSYLSSFVFCPFCLQQCLPHLQTLPARLSLCQAFPHHSLSS